MLEIIFDKIANFVQKHNKAMAGLWVILFLISLIPAFGLMEATETEQTEFLPDVESLEAAEIIAAQFPSEAKSSIMVIITADDVRVPAIENFVMQTAADILSSQDIAYLQSVFTPYDYYDMMRNGTQDFITFFYPLMWGNISRTVFYLQNKTDAFGGSFDLVNDVETVQQWTANIPTDLIVNMYYRMNSTGAWEIINDTMFHDLTFNAVNTTFEQMYEMGGESREIPYTSSISYLLLQKFHVSWIQTFTNVITTSLYHSYDSTSVTEALLSQYAVFRKLMAVAEIAKEPAWQHAQLMNSDLYYGPEFPDGCPKDIYYNFISSKPGLENKTLFFMIGFSEGESVEGIVENVDIIREIVINNLELLPGGAKVYVAGDLAMSIDISEASEQDVRQIDKVTVGLVLILLTVVFMSIITPAVPLVTIGMGVIIAQAILFEVTLITKVPTMVLSVVTVLMMGAGVDYSIFMMARYKEEREKGVERDESVKTSIRWAGESVFSSGMTVAVGFGALLVSTFLFVRMLAVGPMIGIGICLIAAITVIPASLFLFGDKLFWPKKFDNTPEEAVKKSGLWNRLVNRKKEHSWLYKPVTWVVNHPKTVIIVFLVFCAPFIYLGLNVTENYDYLRMMPGEDRESLQGMDVMMEGYPLGKTMPTEVVIAYNTITPLDTTLLNALEEMAKALETLEIVETVKTYTRPEGTPVNYMNPDIFTQLSMQSFYSELNGKSTFILELYLAIEPMSLEALNHVLSIRETSKAGYGFPGNPKILVGGATAMYEDMHRLVKNDEPLWIAIVIIGVFLILLFLLGSVFTPIRLEFTILISVLPALGLTEFVFSRIQDRGIPWMVPIMLFVLFFGLGMDYDIFIVTRMREEVLKGMSDKEAIVVAIDKTGSIITSCGIIMAGAFGSLLLSSGLMFQVMGFAFCVAIILDASVVRIFLVPAIMVLMEKWNWWAPGPLQRVKRD